MIGVVTSHSHDFVSLPKLARSESEKEYQRGPVEYRETPLADNRTLACVIRGLYLFRDGGEPLALLVVPGVLVQMAKMHVSIMAAERPAAERFVRKLAKSVRHGSAFRGKVLSIAQGASAESRCGFIGCLGSSVKT